MTREFTVAVFVVWNDRVLLHRHAGLQRWLPCGGHIEENELPDEAAAREVLEEAGVAIRLLGEKVLEVSEPRQLVRPRGIQLEDIAPGHQHIDLIYFASPEEAYRGRLRSGDPSLGWYSSEELDTLELSDEVRSWCTLALAEAGSKMGL